MKKVDPTQPVQMIVCVDFPNVLTGVFVAVALQNAGREARHVADQRIIPPDWIDAAPGILERLANSIMAELEALKGEVKP